MIDLLHNTSLNRDLVKEGFCQFKNDSFLNDSFYSDLESLVSDIKIIEDQLQPVGYYLSIMHGDPSLRNKINQLVLKYIDPMVDSMFTEASVLTSSIIIKPAHTGRFTTHMNWSCTERLDHSAFTLWIPLNDTTSANGTLKIFPRTHTFFNAPVPVNVHNQYFAEFTDYINTHDQYKPIDVKKGEVLCFDERIVHGSDINNTATPRVVLQVVVTHKPKETCFFFTKENSIESYEINREYFINHGVLDALMGFKNTRCISENELPIMSITKEEFIHKLSLAHQQ